MDEFIKKLKQTKIETLDYFNLSEHLLERCYEPDKWSVRFLLHHLADAETVLYDRIKRVISEPKQVLWAFEQNLWAENLDYSKVPLALSRDIYSSIREGIIYYAGLKYENSDQIQFVHSESGIRTLKDEFEKVVWHNEQHLNQIKKAVPVSLAAGKTIL